MRKRNRAHTVWVGRTLFVPHSRDLHGRLYRWLYQKSGGEQTEGSDWTHTQNRFLHGPSGQQLGDPGKHWWYRLDLRVNVKVGENEMGPLTGDKFFPGKLVVQGVENPDLVATKRPKTHLPCTIPYHRCVLEGNKTPAFPGGSSILLCNISRQSVRPRCVPVTHF